MSLVTFQNHGQRPEPHSFTVTVLLTEDQRGPTNRHLPWRGTLRMCPSQG